MYLYLNLITVGNPSLEGKRVIVEGVTELTDDMIARYFSKFGLLIEWNRDESSSSG